MRPSSLGNLSWSAIPQTKFNVQTEAASSRCPGDTFSMPLAGQLGPHVDSLRFTPTWTGANNKTQVSSFGWGWASFQLSFENNNGAESLEFFTFPNDIWREQSKKLTHCPPPLLRQLDNVIIVWVTFPEPVLNRIASQCHYSRVSSVSTFISLFLHHHPPTQMSEPRFCFTTVEGFQM